MKQSSIVQNNSPTTKRLHEDEEKYICIPLQSNDIYERCDAIHIWSSIYLAHLLKREMTLPSKTDLNDDSIVSKPSDRYKRKNGRTLRGKYLTRRKEKAWWKTVRNNINKLKST